MKTNKILILAGIIFVILILFLIAMFFIKTENYCIEWEGGLTKDLVVFNCVNMLTGEIRCSWVIDEDQNLLVKSPQGQEVKLSCIKYVLAIK